MAGGLLVFMHAERIQESGDNYHGPDSPSGASGAYQFLFSTWRSALAAAGFANTRWYNEPAGNAPANIQDAAASTMMSNYYFQFGRSWYNVAEAWYGGPGAVGHPSWGGGPGFPNVGQYANSVMAIYARLGGQPGGGGVPAVPSVSPFSPGFASSYARFFIDVIEPMGKEWRAYSAPLGSRFYQIPRKVS